MPEAVSQEEQPRCPGPPESPRRHAPSPEAAGAASPAQAQGLLLWVVLGGCCSGRLALCYPLQRPVPPHNTHTDTYTHVSTDVTSQMHMITQAHAFVPPALTSHPRSSRAILYTQRALSHSRTRTARAGEQGPGTWSSVPV